MPAQEKIYSRVTEAEDIVKKLCETYPEELWQVRPETIVVMGIENKERTKSNLKLAVCRAIKGVDKALMEINQISARHIIELYWSDYNQWSFLFKQWLLFHELLHVSEDGKCVKHDIEDFRIIVDAIGVDWIARTDLPDLLGEDKVSFDLSLRPGLSKENDDTAND